MGSQSIDSFLFTILLQELVVGDQSGVIHIWNLQNDQSEQLIPEPSTSIQSISIDSQGLYMAAVNNKVIEGHYFSSFQLILFIAG
jgi:hypothetical protein